METTLSKRHQSFVLMFALCFFGSFSSETKAQDIAAPASITAGALIDQLTDALNSIIGRAEAAGDFILDRAAQELLFALDGLKASGEELLDTTFDKISKERQAALGQITRTTNELSRTADLSLARAEAMTDQVDRLVRQVTLKNYPVVFRYRGTVAVPGETSDLKVRVQGANLKFGYPKLIYNRTTYNANILGEDLEFIIPRRDLKFSDKEIVTQYAELALQRKPGVLNALSWGREDVKYSIDLILFPQRMGQGRLDYTETVTVPKEQSFSREAAYDSSSRNWDCRSYAYSPRDPNYRFDINRSSVTAGAGNSRGELRNVSIQTTGISFQICAKRRFTDRDNGYRHANVNYVETWTVSSAERKSIRVPLQWNSDTVFQATGNASSLLLSVNLFNGRSLSLTGSDRLGPYAEARFNFDQNLVVVKPRLPAELPKL